MTTEDDPWNPAQGQGQQNNATNSAHESNAASNGSNNGANNGSNGSNAPNASTPPFQNTQDYDDETPSAAGGSNTEVFIGGIPKGITEEEIKSIIDAASAPYHIGPVVHVCSATPQSLCFFCC